MCLAIPGRIVAIHDDRGVRMATIDFDGIGKEICLSYLPDLAVGDYAIVHVGFAIAQVDEEMARQTLAMFRDIDALRTELGSEDG
jgi:hydrogenase expression/formation protein HypC